MRRMTQGVAALLSFVMLALPCAADVIGSRPARSVEKERAAVEKRLQELGVRQARQEAAQLSAGDVEYFAANPARIVLAGAQEGGGQSEFFSGSSVVHWYEWVGGLVMLGGGVAAIMFAVRNNE